MGVKNWNVTHEGSEIKAHDRFDEVNRARILNIIVRRPEEFVVNVQKGNDQSRLGLELSYCAGGATLLLVFVSAGLIDTWNKEHPESMLEKGDRLVEVNGVSGNSKDMFQLLTQSDALELKCIKAFK